jgi:hypothetical protein
MKMDDIKKNLGSPEEFENKEVKNTMPQLDDESYDEISNRTKNARGISQEDDNPWDEDNNQDDNSDIINSLLNDSQALSSKKEESTDKKSLYKGNSLGTKKKKLFSKNKVDAKDEQTEENSVKELLEEESVNKEFEVDDTDENVDAYGFEQPETNKKGKDKEVKTNSLNDIEKRIKSGKSKEKNNKIVKLGVICIAAVVILFGGYYAVTNLLPKDLFSGNSSKSNPVPATAVVAPSENTLKTFVSHPADDASYKQGTIKRILGNKVLITPDNEAENVIYYIEDSTIIESHKAGEHIEFEYIVKDYLPYITHITTITEGKIVYKGIMTLNIMIDDSLVKYAYNSDIESTIKELENGDKIQFVYVDKDGVATITEIIDIVKKGEDIYGDDYVPPKPQAINTFNKEDFADEYQLIDSREINEDSYKVFKSDLIDGAVTFYCGFTEPIWIRNAWRATELMQTVPEIEDVKVTLVTPSGIEITEENIDEYGRMWIDGYIINYALREPEIGEYKMVYSKPKGTYLGEFSIFVMQLTGFISIDKFGANLIDRDTLELIWNIGGVPDDGIEMEVYLSNDKFSTLIFSASSKTEELHTIDKRIVPVSNIPRGMYNIIVKVRDIDLKTKEDDPEGIAENTIVVAAETIIDTKNVGILILQ